MNTFKIFLTTLICAFGILFSAQSRTQDRANKRITRNYNVRDFVKIESETAADIRFTQSPDFSVRAEGNQDAIDELQVTVKNGTLVLKNSKSFLKTRKSKRSKVTLFISSPDLQKINSDGVGNITLQGEVSVNGLVIDSDGVGNISAENLICKRLSVDSDGVGNITLKGQAQLIEVRSDGVGNVNLQEMRANNVRVNSDGVGNLRVFASESVDIHADGIGNVTYYGNPAQKHIHKDGIGRVKAGE